MASVAAVFLDTLGISGSSCALTPLDRTAVVREGASARPPNFASRRAWVISPSGGQSSRCS
jgi:hypothetical protein